MKILVIGATGKTGQKLLAQLDNSKRHQITGLIRNIDQADLIKKCNATPLLGDLESDMHMIDHYDAILFVAGSGGKNVKGVDYEGLAKTVDQAVIHNIKRFIYLSSINIGKEPVQYIEEMQQFYKQINETIPATLLNAAKNPNYKTYLEMKTLAENKIITSPLDYTILRAGLLTQDVLSGKVNTTSGILNQFGKISRENVAQCFIEIVEKQPTYRKIYTILDGETPIQQAFQQ